MNSLCDLLGQPVFSSYKCRQAYEKEKIAKNFSVPEYVTCKIHQLMISLQLNPTDFQIVMRDQEEPCYEYRLPKTLILSEKMVVRIQYRLGSFRDKMELVRILCCLSQQIAPIDAEKKALNILLSYIMINPAGIIFASLCPSDSLLTQSFKVHFFTSMVAVLTSKFRMNAEKLLIDCETDKLIAQTSPKLAKKVVFLLQEELEEKKEMRRAYLSQAYPNSCWGRCVRMMRSIWMTVAYTNMGESRFDTSSLSLQQRIQILQQPLHTHI